MHYLATLQQISSDVPSNMWEEANDFRFGIDF